MISSVITWTFKPTVQQCDLMPYYCINKQSTEVMTCSK